MVEPTTSTAPAQRSLASGLPGTQPWEVAGEFDEASGHRAAQELLSAKERPDAIVVPVHVVMMMMIVMALTIAAVVKKTMDFGEHFQQDYCYYSCHHLHYFLHKKDH